MSRVRYPLLLAVALLLIIELGFGVSALAFQPDIPLGVIQGRVTPAQGEADLPPLISATLSLRARHFSITTAVQAGTFEFTELADGNYTITVQAPGYVAGAQALALAGSVRGVIVEVTIPLGKSLAGSADLPPEQGGNTVSADRLAVPKKAVSELRKAEKASQKGGIEKAIQHLLRALEIFPEFSQALNNLGVQYLKQGNAAKAVEAFGRAIEIHPTDVSANFNLGLIHSLWQEPELALPYLLTTVQHDPGNFRAIAMLAESRFNLGDFGQALDHYQQAVRKQPGQVELLLRVADCFTQLSRFDEAIAVLRDFLIKASGHALADTIRGQIRRLETMAEPGG